MRKKVVCIFFWRKKIIKKIPIKLLRKQTDKTIIQLMDLLSEKSKIPMQTVRAVDVSSKFNRTRFYLMNAFNWSEYEIEGKRNWNIYIDNRSTSFELGVLHKFARFAFILSLFLLLLLFSISFYASHIGLSFALFSVFIFICLYFKSIWHGCCVSKTWNGNQNECALWMNELICDSRNCSTKLSYQISLDEIWIEWISSARPERTDPMPRNEEKKNRGANEMVCWKWLIWSHVSLCMAHFLQLCFRFMRSNTPQSHLWWHTAHLITL